MTTPEHPILFSGEMVRAIQREEKRQTRRVVKPQPYDAAKGYMWAAGAKLKRAGYGANYVHTDRHAMVKAMLAVCPYGQVGHRLWVRETWQEIPNDGGTVVYRATDPDWEMTEEWKWRPSISTHTRSP